MRFVCTFCRVLLCGEGAKGRKCVCVDSVAFHRMRRKKTLRRKGARVVYRGVVSSPRLHATDDFFVSSFHKKKKKKKSVVTIKRPLLVFNSLTFSLKKPRGPPPHNTGARRRGGRKTCRVRDRARGCACRGGFEGQGSVESAAFHRNRRKWRP